MKSLESNIKIARRSIRRAIFERVKKVFFDTLSNENRFAGFPFEKARSPPRA